MRCSLLAAVLLCGTLCASESAKPKTVMQSFVETVKSVVWSAFVVPADDGSAKPGNGEDRQPVWDEPSGREPTRTERGRTCQSGDVSRFMPSPFADWLRYIKVLR